MTPGKISNYSGMFILLASLLVLNACATRSAQRDPHDPLEGFNRAVYKVNKTLDKVILKPVAKGYRFITPGFVDTGVSNFFSNLGEITVIVNQFLQLKFTEAGSDTGRFVTNSTIGVAGLIDVASKLGMQKHREDFGQTLGWWGMGTGPYLMLPLFGPSNFRDGPARVADAFTSPLFYVEDDTITYSLLGLSIIDARADLFNAEEIVNDVSYDEYVTIRNAYLDNRRFQVYDGNPPEDDFFEELDESEDGDAQPEPAPEDVPAQ